jgi:hypothetical protein
LFPLDYNLYEFSEMDGPPYAKGLWIEDADDYKNTYSMAASPIRRFADPVEIKQIETEYWTVLLGKLDVCCEIFRPTGP